MEEGITFYQSVPTLFRHFVGTLNEGEQFPKLRLIRLQGEPMYSSDVALFQNHFTSDCILVNSIATTETGSFRLYYVDQNTQITGSLVPVGYPVEGKEVFLLDDSGSRVSFNDIGEIAVRSSFLPEDEWPKPGISQAAFRPETERSSEDIYRTGDLGRMLADGCLIHLGRKDFQVKIRAYRVEVAEVEMALLERDDIKEAVVVAREDRPGNARLVAYVIPASQPTPTIPSLRSTLRETLPEYMVPSAFVFLDAVPTLPNGKLDRLGLPAPGSARPELGTALVGARTPVEQGLLEVWAEVLGLDEVGVHDDFLELGGDSLLAGQVVSRVISEFRVELPLRSLFQAPTVADMALAITQRQAKAADQADIDRLLAELEALSTEEAKQLLAEDGDAVPEGTS